MKPLFLLAVALFLGLAALFWAISGGTEADGSAVAHPRGGALSPAAEPASTAIEMPQGRAVQPVQVDDGGRTTVEVVQSVRTAPKVEVRSVPIRISGAVVSADGPVPNARIEVVSADDQMLGRVDTDQRGKFVATMPAPIEGASVRVIAYGYAPMELYVRRLRAGELRNIGNIRLQRGMSVRGRVVDLRGAPIVDAEISIRSAMGNTPSNRPLRTARSGPDGQFLLRDAPPGRVRVVAQAEGYGERGVEASAARSSDELVIELTPAAALVVRVVDAKGRRIAGASIQISCRDRASPNRDGVSDAEGLSRFDGLGSPQWDMRVSANGYRPASLGEMEADGREVRITIQAWPCLEGTIITPGGRPPPRGTRVQALPALSGGQRTTRPLRGQPVDSDGSFRLCDLRPGDYVVVAEAPGFARSRSQPVRVTLDEDGAAGTLRLEKGGRIELSLSAATGGVHGASVQLHSYAPPRAALWHATALLPAVVAGRSDATGALAFDNLEPGNLWALVRSEDYLPALAGPFKVVSDRTTHPDPITLEPGSRILGVVADEAGQVSPGAVVVITGGGIGSAVQLTADVNGRFRSPPLPGGRYEARARIARSPSRQGLSQPRTIVLRPGEEAEVQIVL